MNVFFLFLHDETAVSSPPRQTKRGSELSEYLFTSVWFDMMEVPFVLLLVKLKCMF